MKEKRRLSREDWTEAALQALAEGGIGAVAIEPLAVRLGTTKGSAYWHFPSREALLRATLERWETERTEAVITQVDAQATAQARLRALFASVFDRPPAGQVELALLGSASDPVVEPVLRRVTERRIDYLTSLFTMVGYSHEAAHRRALLAYTSYLGNAQLRRGVPGVLPDEPAACQAYLDDTFHALGHRPADTPG